MNTSQRKSKLEIRLTSSAQKDLDRLPTNVFNKTIKHLKDISFNPRPSGCKKLDRNCYRIRIGNYRIIYFLEEKPILIARIRHRREVYENLNNLIKRF